jgi:hypothetical protein
MDIVVKKEATKEGRWLTAWRGPIAEVGAYVPSQSIDPKVTIFWHGKPSEGNLNHIVHAVQVLYQKNDGNATVTSYQPEPKVTGPISVRKNLDVTESLRGAQACRAEFSGAIGSVVVWATFVYPVERKLDLGGENIGIEVTRDLFIMEGKNGTTNGLARTVIEESINATASILELPVVLDALGGAIFSVD